jgi:predicted permease
LSILRSMMRDVRLAVRSLRHSPTFALIAVVSLAFGIGASTSVYSLISALFLAPPAGVVDPGGLVRICEIQKGRPKDHELSYLEFVYYRDHATAFSELASDSNPKTLSDTEDGYQLLAAVVSPSYFTVLGLQPRAGRFFTAAEDTALGYAPLVVLSHGYWQRRFGGDTRSIGKRLTLGGTPYIIVGVTPAAFAGSSAGWTPDIFVPTRALFSEADLANQKNGELDLIGRLRPGRTLSDAQAEINVLSREREAAQSNPNHTELLVLPLRGIEPEARSEQTRLPLLLVATVVCLIVIACVNLAGLFQSRHAARGKEIAIRLALGAGRRRVIRQLLTESLVVSALGGIGGLIVAWWGTALLERAYAREMFEGTHHFYPLSLDASAFLWTLLVAMATGVFFGLVPAWQASRPMLMPALKEDASAPRRSRLRAAFLVVQIALSLALLTGAALAIQSARTVRQNPGVDADRVAYFYINPARAGYRGEKAIAYAGAVRGRLDALPVVESVTFSWLPPPLSFATAEIFLPGQKPPRPEDALKVPVNFVSAGFFDTLRIPVIDGRAIDQRDHKRPVVVINEALARRLWPGQRAVGRTLMVDGSALEVAGVVRYEGLRAAGDTARPFLFSSDIGKRQQGSVFVRVKSDAPAALAALRQAIRAADASVPIYQAMPLTRVIANQEAEVAIAMGVLTFAGGLALLLTILGLYGVVALWVGDRTREIGIRIALGARSAEVMTLVLGEGLWLVLIGLPLGLAATLAAVRLLAGYLYGVSPTDAATYAATTTVLAAVALFACYVPARRAMRIDPVHALRQD